MPSERAFVLLIAILVGPAVADAASETGDSFERRVSRLVGMPTPYGPLLLAGDSVSWRVDVPNGTLVHVHAAGAKTGPFYLRVEEVDAAPATFPVPSTNAGFLVPPGAWRLTIDPAGGVAVDITLRLVSAAPFTLTPLAHDRACLLPSVCLP